MKRKLCLLLSLCCVLESATLGAACHQETTESISANVFSCSLQSATETLVVIQIDETNSEETVLDAMDFLKENNQLSYEIKDGMISSINGKKNAADFSSCWMLYTTDEEMSNTAWGTVEYNGKTIASATLGAEALLVEAGELYVWAYATF